MGIEMPVLKKDGLSLEIKDNVLFISGDVSSQNPGEFLEPFLLELHKKIIENKLKELVLNITKLSFLNSAGLRALVDWILLLEEIPEDTRYKITVLCNSSKYAWQKTSINSLIYLAPGFISKKDDNSSTKDTEGRGEFKSF